MAVHFIQAAYTNQAMSSAVYDRLEDGSYVGKVPGCTGVIACAHTLPACEAELRAAVGEWIRLGLSQGRSIPTRRNRYLKAR